MALPPSSSSSSLSNDLLVAVKSVNCERVASLLDAGADHNLADKARRTPLFWASRYGHAEVVRLLLGAGADPNLASKGGITPLSCASMNGHVEEVKLLLD